jgi:hypothetical protein
LALAWTMSWARWKRLMLTCSSPSISSTDTPRLPSAYTPRDHGAELALAGYAEPRTG